MNVLGFIVRQEIDDGIRVCDYCRAIARMDRLMRDNLLIEILRNCFLYFRLGGGFDAE